MTNKTCNKHWISGEGVQMSLFLWLIISKIKKKAIEKGFLETHIFYFLFYFFEKLAYLKEGTI